MNNEQIEKILTDRIDEIKEKVRFLSNSGLLIEFLNSNNEKKLEIAKEIELRTGYNFAINPLFEPVAKASEKMRLDEKYLAKTKEESNKNGNNTFTSSFTSKWNKEVTGAETKYATSKNWFEKVINNLSVQIAIEELSGPIKYDKSHIPILDKVGYDGTYGPELMQTDYQKYKENLINKEK